MNVALIQQNLKQLKLTHMATYLQEFLGSGKEKKHSLETTLWELTQWELKARSELKVQRLLKRSQTTVPKLLSTYALKERQGIRKEDIEELGQGDWVRKAHNVVLYGEFGVGKTHLALGTTRAICQQGLSCLFITVPKLMTQLLEAKRETRLSRFMKALDKHDLIVCDELGFVSATEESAELFFQLIAERYERKSMLFTSNLAFGEWDKVFAKTLLTQAALDRILHHCKVIHIRGHSARTELSPQEEISLTPKV